MSTEDATYGQMLEQTAVEDNPEFWIEEILREAGNVYGRRNGVDARIADAKSVSPGYEGYVLENAALNQKIIGFEVAPLLSENYGTGFCLRPEERSEEYEQFKESIFEALYRDI
jgi:hypothetical protein